MPELARSAGASVRVRAHPRAAREAVGPWAGGMLDVHVTRPPADGEANAAIRRLLARAVGVAPSRVRLVAGERSRAKRFAVDGLGEAELAARLARIGPAD